MGLAPHLDQSRERRTAVISETNTPGEPATGVSRRDMLKFLGSGAVVAGTMASGVGRIPHAAAQTAQANDHALGPRLRSVAWSNGELYGLVEAGPDVATIQQLALKGSTLRPSGQAIAEIAVNAGPVAMTIDGDPTRILVARTTRHVLREETYSFDLSPDLAAWFENEGVPCQDAPTSGTGTYRVTVSRPALSLVGLQRPSVSLPLSGTLPEVSLEPVALRTSPGGFELVATSSGRYGTEANLADEVLVISLATDGSVTAMYSVAGGFGHDVAEVRGLETGPEGFTVSVRGSSGTRFFSGARGRYGEVSPGRSLQRFALHDRIPVAGLANGWLAEVGPGIFVMETDG